MSDGGVDVLGGPRRAILLHVHRPADPGGEDHPPPALVVVPQRYLGFVLSQLVSIRPLPLRVRELLRVLDVSLCHRRLIRGTPEGKQERWGPFRRRPTFDEGSGRCPFTPVRPYPTPTRRPHDSMVGPGGS